MSHPGVYGSAVFNQTTLWSSATDQYGVYVTTALEMFVCKRARDSATWSTYNLANVSGNPLGLPVVADGHRTPAIGRDSIGYLHVMGNLHSSPLWRYVRSNSPDTITAWSNGTPLLNGPTGSSGAVSTTYPQMTSLSDGTLLFFRRIRVGGQAFVGELYLERIPAGQTAWEDVGTIAIGTDDTLDDAPYPNAIWVDENDRVWLHMAWDISPNADGTGIDAVDSTVIYSDDAGDTWKALNGTAMTLPITRANNTAAETTARTLLTAVQNPPNIVYFGGFTTDANGRPYFIVPYDQIGSGPGARDALIKWNGTTWVLDRNYESTFTGIPNLVRWRGDVWIIGARGTAGGGYRLQARNVTVGGGQVWMGDTVPYGWGTNFDHEALRRFGTLEILLANGDVPHVFSPYAYARV